MAATECNVARYVGARVADGADSDDDMFADSDGEAAPAAPASTAEIPTAHDSEAAAATLSTQEHPDRPDQQTGTAHTADLQGMPVAQPATDQPGAPEAKDDEQDYLSWPVSELVRVLKEAQVDTTGRLLPLSLS